MNNNELIKENENTSTSEYINIELSEHMKIAIKENVNVIKEVLKDDIATAIKVIKKLANGFIINIYYILHDYYSDIVNQCKKEHKPVPTEITQVKEAVSILTNLVSGYGGLIEDELSMFTPITTEKRLALGKLCQQEVKQQFDPEDVYDLYISVDALIAQMSVDPYGKNFDFDNEPW